jgi:glycosyltransferase involved in cell wall biosynthesis
MSLRADSRTHPARHHVCLIAPDVWPVLTKSTKTSAVGGAEVQQTILARRFRDLGLQTTVITKVPRDECTNAHDGIRIIDITRRQKEVAVLRNIHPRFTILWRALKQADADIYYARCAGANVFVVGLFCWNYGRRFVYSAAHDFDLEKDQTWRIFRGRGGWRDRHLYQRGLSFADAIVVQHAGQVEACLRWYRRNATEIPNCYEPPSNAVAKKNGVILWAATLKTMKRPHLLLDLARRLPHLRFRMLGGPGQGDEAAIFNRIAQEAAMLPNVEFVGLVPFTEAERHFDEARLLVNTSESEGFPNTFLQSWARGIPTVSFVDCQARDNREPVGFVCGDMEAMTARVAQLATDDTMWAEAGNRARRYHREHHSVDAAVGRYIQLFASLYPNS